MCLEDRQFIFFGWSKGYVGVRSGSAPVWREANAQLSLGFLLKVVGAAKGFWWGGSELCFRENDVFTVCEMEWKIKWRRGNLRELYYSLQREARQCQNGKETGRSKEGLFSKAPGGGWPRPHLDSRLPSSRTMRVYLSIIVSPHVYVCLL